VHLVGTSSADAGAGRRADCCRPGGQTTAAPTSAPAAAPAQPAAAATRLPRGGEAAANTDLVNWWAKLEGATIAPTPPLCPRHSRSALLAQLVKAGSCPVDQRLPQEPMCSKPAHEVGRYGGTWRRAFTGPADAKMNRIMATGQDAPRRLHGIK